jgi:hypothetical protein
MLGLLDLAPELLNSVIQCLIPEREFTADADLYRLARVSRQLYNITEPYLYTKFIQTESKTTSTLLRTLLEKPEYASRMKMIHGYIRSAHEYLSKDEDDVDEGGEGAEDLKLQRDNEDLASMIKACKSFNLHSDNGPTREQWVSALTSRKPEACFAIMVLLLPNLKSLSMTTITRWDNFNATFFSQVINLVVQSPNLFLTKLENLSYNHEYSEHCIYIEAISPFIYLPSLREVTLYNLSAAELMWEKPFKSQIEVLDIENSAIDDEVWPVLLQPMHHLKRLTYTLGYPNHVAFMNNSLEGLTAGLQVVKNTLEFLYAGEYFLDCEEILLGTLRDFPKLREINVQMGMLIGLENNKSTEELWEKLPFGLEKVSFDGGEDGESEYDEKSRQDTVEQVMGVVLTSETHFPSLRHISMRSYGNLDLEPLKAICTERGIVLN